jgi:ABC-type antimicrobial peptide transport system permease subunit
MSWPCISSCSRTKPAGADCLRRTRDERRCSNSADLLLVFAIGLVLGTLAAVIAVRAGATAVADLLYGITATDAANVVMAVGVMGTAALVACLMPAYRATRVDPLVSLKEE